MPVEYWLKEMKTICATNFLCLFPTIFIYFCLK